MKLQVITTPYDKVLAKTVTTLERPVEGDMALEATAAAMEALRACWAEDCFLHVIVSKFLKLHLQIIERYRSLGHTILKP